MSTVYNLVTKGDTGDNEPKDKKIVSRKVDVESAQAGLLPENHDTVEVKAEKGGNF